MNDIRSRLDGAAARLRAGRGRIVRRGQPAGPVPSPRPPVVGMVEQFSRRLVVGWISVPPDTGPVRITLHLGRLKVAATYATADPSMSGADSVLRTGGETAVRSTAGELVHRWQVPNVPGPADDRRNSNQEIRTFSFRVREIWPYVKKGTRITVRVNGRPLPIYGHGTYLLPPRNGKHTLAELERKFEEGYLFSQYGRLQLSKKLDVVWQQNVMRLYRQTRQVLAEEFGYDAFLVYGTLLGAVREGGYIGHDVDFDAAYVSRLTDGRSAAQELVDIAVALIDKGLKVVAMDEALHIHDPDDDEARIDLFHTYFDERGELCFPFGYAGTRPVTREEWTGLREVSFSGGDALVPVAATRLVEHLYGADWERPKPGFNWNLDRVGKAEDGVLSTEQRSKVYWTGFYAFMEYTEGSTFFEFVNARPDTPANVIDIGCGDGRDSCAFAAAGRNVLGVDRSDVAVDHATRKAKAAGVDERASFAVCDVSDPTWLRSLLAERLATTEGPTMFYLRFFLHSIPEDVQDNLMGVLAELARPGDMLAAEFRTDKDETRSKVHGQHYRRFQNGAEFGDRLRSDHGFTVLHEEEGSGLSPYKDEDPILYRTVARRQ